MPPRNKRSLSLLIALAAGVGGAALAQSQPESILPPGFGEQPAPAPNPPAASPSPSATAPAGDARARSPNLSNLEDLIEGVEAQTTTTAPPVEYPTNRRRDPAVAGILSTESLGIAAKPWGSAHGKFLSLLLRRTDTPLASRWAQIGLRNVLLARAAAPGLVNPADWTAERAWLLLKLGEADAARMLVWTTDTDRFTPKMVQIAAQASLAASDPSGLCALETRLSRVEPKVAPLVTAICASLAGEAERAAADIDAIRRRGRLSIIDLALADKVVGAGADTARAVTIEWEPVETLNIWRYGLSTATALMPPERLMRRADSQVRAWFARAPMFSAQQKLEAANTAAALGVMSSDAMVDLYSAAYDSIDPDELGGSVPWRLRQAFVGKDRAARLSALRELWGKDDDREKQLAGWVLTARAATLIAPDADLQDDAPNIVAALLAGGFDRQAARWAAVVGSMDDERADRVWAMLALGIADPGPLGIDIDRIEEFADRDSSKDKRRTGLLVAGLAGLGRIDAQTAGSLNTQYRLGIGRQSAWTRLIDGAAMRRQAGTSMILAAMGMQAPSANDIPALYMFHATNALRRTGQEQVARMMAAEALART